MMVSTKGRYALRVMIDLAEHDDRPLSPLRGITAARQGSRKNIWRASSKAAGTQRRSVRDAGQGAATA